jgi:hypothetical protein
MKMRGLIFLLTVSISGALAAPVEIKLPAETSRLLESPLPGYPLAQAMCATCHSADYLKMQPVSSRTYWKAAVTKMQKTYGAPIPEESMDALVDYLVKTYGNERAGPERRRPRSRRRRRGSSSRGPGSRRDFRASMGATTVVILRCAADEPPGLSF